MYKQDELKVDQDGPNGKSDFLKDSETDYKHECGILGQPIYIDFIIKIMLCRVYVNVMDKKLLTGEKILEHADRIIKNLNPAVIEAGGSGFRIVTYPKIRNQAKHFPYEMLHKKFLL